ncbi:g10337 [Coccomyxa elongata]
MNQSRSLITICILSVLQGAISHSGINRNADLQRKIYLDVKNAPACVRLLNATGSVGCASEPVSAPLLFLSNAASNPVPDDSMVLVPEEQQAVFLQRLQASSAMQKRVKGVLVLPGSPASLTYADRFPLAPYAPYAASDYAWNRNGTIVSMLGIGTIPVFLLEGDAAAQAQQHAEENALKGFRGPVHVAELDATMWAAGNASACITQGTCLPLGGHSVWAALPPLPASGKDNRPIILVAAGVDSMAFFHDRTKGADAPLSGLVAMLAAAEALGNSSYADVYRKRIVFAAFSGEPWGYMGSKRFLWELHSGENSTRGLSLNQIEQMVEVGQVGRAADEVGQSAFYLHFQRGAPFGAADDLVEAFLRAGDDKAEISEASGHNPGIPPSSLMSFLRVKPGIAGVVLEEFNTHFINPFYHSRLDINISIEAVTSAAIVLARALHETAYGGSEVPLLKVTRTAVHATVAALVECLLMREPGLGCQLADRLISPVSRGEPMHYISTLPFLGQDSQDPSLALKKDVERFLWNFLASRTASGPVGGSSGKQGGCDFSSRRCAEGAVCVGYRALIGGSAGRGRCLLSTARYVPSYSTRFGCKDCEKGELFQWALSNRSIEWEATTAWPPDPMWTESNWPPGGVPQYRLYQREAEGAENRLLMGGVIVLLLSAAATTVAQAVYAQRLKQR